MTTELRMLALSIVLSSHATSFRRGYQWSAGSRGDPLPQLKGAAGRLERALRNFLETFPLFAAAILTAHVAGRHDWMTIWGAQLYFWARLAYVPLYVLGVPVVRSLVWNLAFAGIALLLLATI